MSKILSTVLFISFIIMSCTNKIDADHVYKNAVVWTGDSALPSASVVAIKGNKIVYVGDQSDNITGEMIDLEGQMVVPGFQDNHVHFLMGGYGLSSVQLKNAKTKEEFINTLAEFCRSHPGDFWIQGGDWDHEAWGGELPARSWIDSVSGDHPIFIMRYDGHMALANSKALEISKVDRNTKTPPGGEIIHDAKGEPTGIIKDEAFALVDKNIPPPSEKQYEEYFLHASTHAVENGVTTVQDMGSYGGWPELETYRKARTNDKMLCRIYSFVPLKDWKKLDEYVKANGKGDDMLHWGGLKGFVDGSLGSTTAWFYLPYLDAPNTSGFTVTDTADLRNWVLSADAAGLHVAVHAIGDHANDFILSVFETAEKNNPEKDHRFRIEHAQHLSDHAIATFAKLKVIASMQPYHLVDDGNWAYKRLDEKRLKGTYAFKSLLDNGATLSFGSDWTVAPLAPLLGIQAAVTRQTGDGKNPGGWFPEQKITVEQALRNYTAANAYGSFMEDKLGKIKTGMLADLTILDKNLLTIDPKTIKDVRVMRTVVDGKEVYNSSHSPH
ncbi:MAG TPA: amidohydrolase [Chitinophagaceae bacterium]|nr:amidohydrolase [Chitinophagaceae bacterium]